MTTPATTHHPITRAQYDALPGINQSSLKHLEKSPRHFQYAMRHPKVPTPAMLMGKFYDALLFGMECDAVISPFPDFRTKESQVWKETNLAARRTVITQAQERDARSMIAAVSTDPAAAPLLASGQANTAFTAEIEGIPVKGLTDLIVNGAALILDLKVTTDASRGAWQRHIVSMGYDVQAAMYTSGMKAATGDDWSFGWIVVEDEPPHVCAVWIAEETILRRGRAVLKDRLLTWDACMKSGVWPGYTPTAQRIDLPNWERKLWEAE